MSRKITIAVLTVLFVAAATIMFHRADEKKDVKIGVSIGVGNAIRWENEKRYMEARAKELGANIEVRLNKTNTPKTQQEDCREMIDKGIDVLILTPRSVANVDNILEYAKSKNVPVICYARVVLGKKIDLFVGYDSARIGQKMGQYISEAVYKGDYILLRGDSGDNNAALLYEGAMRYISQIRSDINIILDCAVPGWSPSEAKRMVKEAISANGNRIDAILSPNDKIAEACAEALEELGIKNHVAITGMDAELEAVRRIVKGRQDVTFYMALKELSATAVNEAFHMARGEKVNVNADFDNHSGGTVPSNLITGQLVTKENLNKVLIDSGYFTKEEVYGK